MDLLRDFLNSLGTPQITWAMIFAALGYLGKTIVDYYTRRRQAINELHAKSEVERLKEQEAVRVSVLSQILLANRTIGWICHQFLGHAKNRAEAIIRQHVFLHDEEVKLPVYSITEMVLGLGSLLAQLQNFRTYQYIRIQAQIRDVNLLEKIDDLEEILSQQGVYRRYQADLALYALKAPHDDLAKIVKSGKQRAKAPSYLREAITWAEKLVNDFVNAWIHLGRQIPRNGYPTLAELGTNLSEFIRQDYRPEYEIKPDASQLQVSDESVEFVRALTELHTELRAVFAKLDRLAAKH